MPRWPIYDEEQIEAVAAVLRSDRVNAWTGPDVAAFEREYAEATGARFAVAMANGSVTLDAALQVLGLGPGDEVIVTPRSFVASASCVLLAGGIPVFADVDSDSQNITPDTVAPLIGPRTRGIIPVHLAGWPCDMDGLMALARKHDLWVIEDCAQAHGAKIDGLDVGRFGTLGSLSFCQDKIISTGGEGGMILTDDPDLHERLWSFKDHGKYRPEATRPDPPPGFRWLHSAGPGTNLRMTGLSAALGRIQLRRLREWTRIRARNAGILAEALADHPLLRVPLPPPNLTHAWYRFYAFLRPERLRPDWTRDRILAKIQQAGFPAFSGSCSEIYKEGIFTSRGLGPKTPLPVARVLGETSLAFLIDPSWSVAEIEELASVICEVADEAAR